MKNVTKKSSKIIHKNLVSKNTDNEIVTKKFFKDELKSQLKDFVTKEDLKNELKKFVTKDTFKKEMDRIDKRFESIDKRFEDQTNTILTTMENLLDNVVHRLEVNFEKEREENKVFRESVIHLEKKTQNIDKRVIKLEQKVFVK